MTEQTKDAGKDQTKRIRNPEYMRNAVKKSYQKHSERVKARVQEWRNKYYFGGNKNIVLERDNWTCQKCGMTNEQHILIFGMGISVDHIDGQGINSKIKNNNPDNLITLCLRCHGNKDRLRAMEVAKKQ